MDDVIKEMSDYSNLGLPNGEGSMGMGTPGRAEGGRIKDAYKINSLLRNRNAGEQQEDTLDDMDGAGEMDFEVGNDGDMEAEGNVEEIKAFFMDNPDPSDEEVMQYAEENGMDMQEMRKAVYSLIQSLLPSDEEGMDDDMGDYDDMGDGDVDGYDGMSDSGGMSGDEEREIVLRNGRRFRRRRYR